MKSSALNLPPAIVDHLPDFSLARRIMQAVALGHGLAVRDLITRSRREPVVLPRMLAMFLVRDLCHMTAHATGKLFKREHGTVLGAVNTIQNRAQTEPPFKAKLEQWRAFNYSEVPEFELPKTRSAIGSPIYLKQTRQLQ